jgi:hypothetical protein
MEAATIEATIRRPSSVVRLPSDQAEAPPPAFLFLHGARLARALWLLPRLRPGRTGL